MVSCKRSFQLIHWHLEIADQHQQLQSAAARQDLFLSPLSHLCFCFFRSKLQGAVRFSEHFTSCCGILKQRSWDVVACTNHSMATAQGWHNAIAIDRPLKNLVHIASLQVKRFADTFTCQELCILASTGALLCKGWNLCFLAERWIRNRETFWPHLVTDHPSFLPVVLGPP